MATTLGPGPRSRSSHQHTPLPSPTSVPNSTTINQSQLSRHYQFLPESFDNQIPPSPHYHSIVGESFIYLDWKLIAPKEKICCYNCAIAGVENCELTATKTNFSHNKSLFPVWSAAASRPIPCCQTTSAKYILSSLSMLPAASTFAINWQTNLNTTWGPVSKYVSNPIYYWRGICVQIIAPKWRIAAWSVWRRREKPANRLWILYLRTLGERNAKCPAKCMFTMNKGSTKEIVLYAIVDSTAVSQVSHLFGKEFLVMISMFYWDCFISCSESRILWTQNVKYTGKP